MKKLKVLALTGLLSLMCVNMASFATEPVTRSAQESAEDGISIPMNLRDVNLYDENGNLVSQIGPMSLFGKCTIPAGYTMTFKNGDGWQDYSVKGHDAVINFDKKYKHDAGIKLVSSGKYKSAYTNKTSNKAIITVYCEELYYFYVTNKTNNDLQVTSGEVLSHHIAN